MLTDPSGRSIEYLRLSVTKACGMRCLYCRPAATAYPADDLLTPGELESLVRHLVSVHGLGKVRITGGEPTTRRELPEIIARLGSIAELRDVALTTNGLTLRQDAHRLRDAGLSRVNVSLDSLDAERFARITGVAGLERVLAGIDAALDAGLAPLKLNTVVLRGINDDELPSLAAFAAGRGVEVRFIELMPMGPLVERYAALHVSERSMRARLAPHIEDWGAPGVLRGAARVQEVRLLDGRLARVGFVTPMSHNFCDRCNRLRIAADGALYPCLMAPAVGSVRAALRPSCDGVALDAILAQALASKSEEHPAAGHAVMLHVGG